MFVQFLCNGLEDHVTLHQRVQGSSGPAWELEQLVNASGKMVLVSKLLPKLRAEGHKVWHLSLCRSLWYGHI